MFKNGSRIINTHQKEQQRNKKEGIEGAEEGDRDGVTSKAPLKPFKVALRSEGDGGFITARRPADIKESI